jgi:hypothetical protein
VSTAKYTPFATSAVTQGATRTTPSPRGSSVSRDTRRPGTSKISSVTGPSCFAALLNDPNVTNADAGSVGCAWIFVSGPTLNP